MLYGERQYGEVPALLGQFIPKLKHHEYSPKKADSVWETIKHDHTITAFHIFSRMLQGAGYGIAICALVYMHKKTPKKIITDRQFFDQKIFLKRFVPNAIYGALGGFGWWFLHDTLLCPHGNKTFGRSILAHSIAGSILGMAVLGPASFGYGAFAGAFIGLKNDMHNSALMPKDFQLQFINFDPQQRERARRDQAELNLSKTLQLSEGSLQYGRFLF